MRNRASMPTSVWLKILLLSVLFHLLLLVLFWPALKELFRDPEQLPGMQFNVTVGERPAPVEPITQPQEPEAEPEKEEREEEQPAEEETPPEPEPEPEPEEQLHLPRDTDETVDLDGTDVEAPEQEEPLMEEGASEESTETPPAEGEGEGSGPSGKEITQERARDQDAESREETSEPESGTVPVETSTAGESEIPDSDSASMSLGEEVPPSDAAAPSIPDDALGGGGGIQSLDDEEMDAVRGESPISEIEERRIRMANEYLARMKQQIVARWEQPETADERHKGEIRFSVDTRGYLSASRIHLPSGHKALDESALKAVRAVDRYRVPDSPSIVRQYYQTLRFTYSGAPADEQ